MEIYQPSDDSYFFADFLESYLKNNKVDSYLDMGTGSGILAETAKKCGVKKILAVDINPESVKFVKQKNLNALESDLFSKLKNKKFDLITFNAPYLPEDKHDKEIDITGGKKGDEISLKFLKQAKKHLTPNGKIFLLISSHTPLDRIKKFNVKIVAKKKLFFEELMILEVR